MHDRGYAGVDQMYNNGNNFNGTSGANGNNGYEVVVGGEVYQ